MKMAIVVDKDVKDPKDLVLGVHELTSWSDVSDEGGNLLSIVNDLDNNERLAFVQEINLSENAEEIFCIIREMLSKISPDKMFDLDEFVRSVFLGGIRAGFRLKQQE